MPTYTKTAGSVKNVAITLSVGPWSSGGSTWNGAAQSAINQFTDYVCFYNFGFAIPSNEVIVGISVTYTAQNYPNTTETASDYSVVLTTNASTKIGGSVDHATGANYSNISLTNQTRGNSADTWSAGLTYTQANGSNFGVMVAAQMSGNGFTPPYATSQSIGSAPTITITTTVSAPNPPTGLTASWSIVGSSPVVDLNWTNSAGATSYKMYRSNVSGSGYSLIASGLSGGPYNDSTVSFAHSYYYVVTAVSAGGESGYSNEAGVNIPARSNLGATMNVVTVMPINGSRSL